MARRGGSAFLNRARKALTSIYRRIQSILVDVVGGAQRIINRAQAEFTSVLSRIDFRLPDREISKTIARYFRSAINRSNADFANTLEEALEDRDKLRKQIKLNDLRARGLIRFVSLLERVAAGKFQTPEEALAEFFESIEPVMLAIRVVETGDPTIVSDPDVESRLVEMASMFMEFASVAHRDPLRIASMAEVLADEMMRDARIAGFRFVLASQVVRDRVLADLPEATISSVFRGAESVSDELLSEIEEAMDSSKQVSPQKLIQNIAALVREAAVISAHGLSRMLSVFGVDAVKRAMRQEGISVAEYMDAVKDAFAGAHKDAVAGAHGEQEEEEEDNVIYGVWVRNAKRTVEKSCADCEALEALTSLKPVPITELPTPGVETQCGANCACDVEEVSGDEFMELYAGWKTVYREVFESELPESPEEIPPALIRPLLHMVLSNYQSAEKWAKRLDIL